MNKMKISKKVIIAFMSSVLIISFIIVNQNMNRIVGYIGIYSEDFTTTDYLDSIYTNATGWGEGEIRLKSTIPDFEIVGSHNTSDESEYLLVEGNYAYTLTNHALNNLQIIDITNTSNPILNASKIVSTSLSGLNEYSGLFLNGDYLYALRESIFTIFNITDPTNPSLISTWDTGGSFDICVDGDLAYLAFSANQLWVLDVSDPSNGGAISQISPQVLDVYYSGSSSIESQGITTAGNFLYFNAGENGIQILNCSDPSNIEYVSSYDDYNASFYPRDMWLEGNYLYLTVSGSSASRIEIIDVTSPYSPFRVAQISSPLSFSDVYIEGNFAYITSDYTGCQIVNITSPFSPHIIGNFSFSDTKINDIFVEGDYAFIADSWNFHIVKISDYVKANEVGNYHGSLSGYTNVRIDGNLAYITTVEGLEIVNLTNTFLPTYVGEYQTGISTSLSIDGDLVYLGDFDTGIVVVNVSDPSNPSYVGEYGDFPNEIDVLGDTAFISATPELQIVDVSDPSNPSLISSYIPASGIVWGVYIYGDKAFISKNNGLEIIDISNLNSPHKIGGYSTTTSASSIVVKGTYSFLCCGSDGLKVFDITNPYSPLLIDTFDTSGSAFKVFASADRAYVADSQGGLVILDISDPRNITLEDYFLTPYDIQDVVVKGDYAYIIDQSDSLYILEIMKSKVRQKLYENQSLVQSSLVFSDDTTSIFNATLSANDYIPTDTSITYYLSVDDGLHWEEIQSSLDHSFIYSGYQIKWRAILESTNISSTPTLSSLSISFNVVQVILEFGNLSKVLLSSTVISIVLTYVNKKNGKMKVWKQ